MLSTLICCNFSFALTLHNLARSKLVQRFVAYTSRDPRSWDHEIAGGLPSVL